ncbi:hypothetical protein RI054_03g16310 [Pseudoscourfieldia marina]
MTKLSRNSDYAFAVRREFKNRGENRRRRLALPVQGRGGGRNGGRTGGEEAATPNVSTRATQPTRQNANCPAPHTHDTPMCYAPGGARHDPDVGAATPTQAAEVAVDEADIKVAEADEEDDTRCRHSTAAALHATATPKLPTAWSKYIVDNASPYTLTGSLNHLYDVQQLEKPKEIGGIKKDSTIKCTHVGKIDFTTHEGTLTVSNAYYGFYFGQIDVETAYLYALILERFGFTSAAKSATTPLAHGTTLTRADEEDAEARHLAQQFVGAILYAAVISRPDLSSTVRAMSHVMSKPPSNFEACKKHVLRYLSGTINRGIKYNTNSNVPLKLIGYRDASWGDNHENRRSTSGYIFFLNGGPISWASYLHNRSLINS